MFRKLRDLWLKLTAPYDEELCEAIETVCRSCKYHGACCDLCPVSYIETKE